MGQMIASFAGGETKKSDPLEKEVARLKEQLATYENLAKAVAAFQAFTPPKEEKAASGKGEGKGKGKGKGEKGEAKEKAKGKEGEEPASSGKKKRNKKKKERAED